MAVLPKRKRVTFEEILKQPRAEETWATLNDVPEIDRAAVKRRLEALANRTISFRWHPPIPRDARRLAGLLMKVAQRIERMNLYFGSALPLGNLQYRNLPETVNGYATALEEAAGSRQKQRPGSYGERNHELEIVRLLDQSSPQGGRCHYEEAAALIQAAYDAGGIKETITVDALRHAYNRQSYHYRRPPLANVPVQTTV
jgi:hypothetical protein